MTAPNAPGLECFSLSGRVALVTGATRGLGLEIARGMAAAGASVGINGRDAQRADEIAKRIPNAFAAPFDITDLSGATDAIDSIVARHGRLEALMRARAVELGDKGIAVNAIAPGFFLTERNAPFFAQPRIAELARRIPLRRFGRPDELVGAAIFLASDAASYISGQVLTVDAGLSIAL